LEEKRSLGAFKWDPLPGPEPIPEDPGVDPDPDMAVATDFLKMDQPEGPAWPGNPRGFTLTNLYPDLAPQHRAEMRKALKLRNYTHIVVTARAAGDLGVRHNYYQKREKLTAALEELLANGIQPILFLCVDDDPWMKALSTENRIDLFLHGLKHWHPYVAHVVTGIEWDEWASRDALVATVKAIKKEYPKLSLGVHFLADWPEKHLRGFRGYERFPGADFLCYQQPPNKKDDNGKIIEERLPRPHIYKHVLDMAGRCKRDGWGFWHAEYRQERQYTEEDSRNAGDGGLDALRELEMPLSFMQGAHIDG
jgi:hypothetical protein